MKFSRKSLELAIRRALGATRGHIFVQLCIEVLLLSLMGGALGVIGCAIDLSIVRDNAGAFSSYVRVDGALLVSALMISLLAGVAMALVPGFKAMRAQPSELIREA